MKEDEDLREYGLCLEFRGFIRGIWLEIVERV